ncbi:MAG TPA: hypothetical protein VFE72_00995 [Lysobacter sp.]|nr:hypothetical protein [Lysobacter sp.]
MIRVTAAAAFLVALTACSAPEAPERDTPVEPQAAARHDDLRRTIDAPLERARGAQAAVDAAAASRADAIEQAEAGT